MTGAHQPYALPLGPLAVVVPNRGMTLSNVQRVDLAAAVLLQAGRYEGPARAMIARLEQRLGVHVGHREALATSPEQLRARLAAEKRRRLLDANRQAARAEAPVRDPVFAHKVGKAEAKLRDAQQGLDQLRAGDPKKNRKAIKRGENRIRDLAKKLSTLQAVESEAYALMGEAREPLLRAMQRGETVQAKEAETADFALDDYGARIIHRTGPERGLPALVYSRGLRAKNLSGLEHARHAGYLTKIKGALPADRLMKIGSDYAAAYVVVAGQAKHAGEGGGGFKPKAPVPRQIEAGELLADMRSGLTPRQRDALDLICGQDMRVREAAAAVGAGAPATLRALVLGLRAAEAGRIAAVKRRQAAGEVPVGARVAAVNAVLKRARA